MSRDRGTGGGAELTQLLFSGAVPGPTDPRGVRAVLGILDVERGEVIHRCEYMTPAELRAPVQKMQFTGSARDDGRLYVCAHNEVVFFEGWPPVEPAGRLTLPGFNDLHHCLPWKGGLVIANTGLETVDHVSLDGELISRWDLLDGIEGARTIDPGREYRRLDDVDLKPHRLHANHLFVRDGKLWVTQLRTSRAVCLTDAKNTIEFEAGMPHDGRYIRDRLVFTTTNGHLVIVDPASLEMTSHHLPALTPGAEVLGWCRGVCEDPRGPGSYFVAFSTQRETRWREYAFWAKHSHKPLPSRIDTYDLDRGERVESVEMTRGQSLTMFQLDLLPPELWI